MPIANDNAGLIGSNEPGAAAACIRRSKWLLSSVMICSVLCNQSVPMPIVTHKYDSNVYLIIRHPADCLFTGIATHNLPVALYTSNGLSRSVMHL